jgi:hypothetical protein
MTMVSCGIASAIVSTRVLALPRLQRDEWTDTRGLFSWQNFWRNAIVAVSLLFGKYYPIMV